jgi:iron complex outermembrane receptor protein
MQIKVLASLLLLMLTDVALCQQTDLAEKSLEELMQMTVSTASKHEQPVTEAPASVTVITADGIRKYGYRTLADALRSVR